MASFPDFQKKRVELRKWATDLKSEAKTRAKGSADAVISELDIVRLELKEVVKFHDETIKKVVDQSVEMHKKYGELADLQKDLKAAEKAKDKAKIAELTKIIEAKHKTLEGELSKMNKSVETANKRMHKLDAAKKAAKDAYLALKV